MDVNGPSSVQGTQPVNRTKPTVRFERPGAEKPATPQDELEISTEGKLLQDMAETSQMRKERLEQIKAAIDDGTYETSEKLEAALSVLINEVEGQIADPSQ